MLKIGFTFAFICSIVLFFATFGITVLKPFKTFYLLFSVWFILWEVLTFIFLTNNHGYDMLFYAILAGSSLTLTALSGTLFSPDTYAVTYLMFLILIPGLYVERPTGCIITTILAGSIFCMMVFTLKTNPSIVKMDIMNTIFAMIIGVSFNLYNMNIHLKSIQSATILKEQSNLDELTSLPNRRCFNNFIEDFFASYDDREVNIIMMDIDYFKKFNDAYGHLRGDECLETIGHTLKRVAKKYGVFVARYGGEEFIAVDYKNGDERIQMITEAFVSAVDSLAITNKYSTYNHITLCAGYASLKQSGAANYMQLIDFADEALYKAKANGRNRSIGFKKVKAAS